MPQSSADLAKQFGGVSADIAKRFGGVASTPSQPTITPGASPLAAQREASQQLWGTADPAKVEQPSTLDHALNMVKGGLEVPYEMATGLWGLLTTNPTDTIKGIVNNSLQQLAKANEERKKGELVNAASDVVGAVPLVGPAVVDLREKVAAGKWDEALGKGLVTAASLKPSMVAGPLKGAVATARATGLADKVANAAQRGAEARIVDVMAPKLGRNKLRFGADAEKVAGAVAAEPGLGAASRQGLGQKVAANLEAAEVELDKVRAARDANVLYETKPITALLEDKIKELKAVSAEGPEAHAQIEAMGLKEKPGPPKFGTPFRDLSREHKEFFREIRTEMEEMPSVKRESAAQESGHAGRQYGEGSGNYNEGGFIGQEAGAGVYDRLAGSASTGRTQVIRALRRYEAGEGPMSPIVKRALEVAEERLAEGRSSGMFSDPADVSGPIGQSVLPGDAAKIRAAKIRRAIDEIEQLGPAANYEALRKIRQAYGQEAAVKYSPSMTQDFLKVQPVVEGAADVTGVLRDALGIFDPPTAAANAQYTIWRKANDVLRATEEIERSRPRVGRGLIARLSGTIGGGAAAGGLGATLGFILAPMLESVIGSGVTTKITTARMLSDVSKALKTGNIETISTRLQALQKFSRALTANKQAQQSTAPQESQ